MKIKLKSTAINTTGLDVYTANVIFTLVRVKISRAKRPLTWYTIYRVDARASSHPRFLNRASSTGWLIKTRCADTQCVMCLVIVRRKSENRENGTVSKFHLEPSWTKHNARYTSRRSGRRNSLSQCSSRGHSFSIWLCRRCRYKLPMLAGIKFDYRDRRLHGGPWTNAEATGEFISFPLARCSFCSFFSFTVVNIHGHTRAHIPTDRTDTIRASGIDRERFNLPELPCLFRVACRVLPYLETLEFVSVARTVSFPEAGFRKAGANGVFQDKTV